MLLFELRSGPGTAGMLLLQQCSAGRQAARTADTPGQRHYEAVCTSETHFPHQHEVLVH